MSFYNTSWVILFTFMASSTSYMPMYWSLPNLCVQPKSCYLIGYFPVIVPHVPYIQNVKLEQIQNFLYDLNSTEAVVCTQLFLLDVWVLPCSFDLTLILTFVLFLTSHLIIKSNNFNCNHYGILCLCLVNPVSLMNLFFFICRQLKA